MNIVIAESLSKHYRSFRALDECSLSVPEGEVYGLLGPNGAGKTTLIRTLLGYLRPTSGTAKVCGRDCFEQSVEVRRQVAYLPAEAKLFRSMRGSSVLEFFASIHPLGDHARAKAMAGRLQLDLSRRVAFMSTGMRQKLALAAVISCNAPLLILDEPTANLDPTVRNEILTLIAEVNQQGKTVLLCSHILQEIEEVCKQAAILRAGKVVHIVDVPQLRSVHRIRGEWTKAEPFSTTTFMQAAAKTCSIAHCEYHEGRLVLDLEGPLEQQWSWLESLQLREVRVEPVGLRSVYEKFHGNGGESRCFESS